MENKVRYVLKHVLDDLYELGKGIKKGELQRQMQKLTGVRESHFIHSSTTKVRYERAMMTFCDYLEDHSIKREKHLEKLSTEELQQIVDNYFRELAEEGYSKNTIKVHVAAMEKSLAIVRPDIRDYLANDENRIGWWSAGEAASKGDSYVDSNAIKERLEEEHQAIARIQELTGCRVREIPRMTVDEEKYKITIHQAKGGRTRTLHYEHRKEQFKEVCNLLEKINKEKYEKELKDYYRDLKQACDETGQEYHGSHAFRYQYAQERIEELRNNKKELRDLLDKYGADNETKECVNDNNKIDRAADYVITQELGHNRLSMSRYYYRK